MTITDAQVEEYVRTAWGSARLDLDAWPQAVKVVSRIPVPPAVPFPQGTQIPPISRDPGWG